jgi:RHS repeat-associated protein
MAGRRGARGWRGVAVLGSAVVVAGLLVPAAVSPASAASRPAVPKNWKPKAPLVKVLPRTAAKLPAHPVMPKVPEGARPDSAWPTAGVGTALADGQVHLGGLLRAGGVPVAASMSGVGMSGVSARLLGQQAAQRLGLTGVVFTVAEDGLASGPVRVGLDYASFANAAGGDWADRLHLVELPGCALTTPQLAACRRQTPVDGLSVDHQASMVSGIVSLAGAASPVRTPGLHLAGASAAFGTALVMAAVAGPSGSNGDFTATSLAPQESWTGGGQDGDFTWTYPITVPPPAAGSAPQVSLDYDSASVDGRVASTNNQFGVIGEGFTMSTDSYIERTYADCADDPEGAISGDYDNCWAGNVVTMSLDGASTQLVLDDTTKTWHEAGDGGDEIQYLTGTAANTGNGTYDNDYWEVIAPDGTQYYFGKNKGPGWASGDPVTDSAFTEPVYGAHSGDPCYNSAGFAQSSCTQAWRWNLDFVIDPNGNSAAYYYSQEDNYYGADNQTTGVEYVRGGYLNQIDYGLRDENGSIYAGSIDANPPDEVIFTAAQRCIPTSGFACQASQFNSTNASDWPDTPEDQMCTSGQSCSNHAPTFWSQMRVDQISTQYWNGSKYVPVDSWALNQGFPTSGDPELILNSITRTGYTASGSSLSLLPVNLSYNLLANRIPGYNNEPAMAHWRLTNIETETGEVVDVSYSSPCTASEIPANPWSNNTLCYPVMWTPEGDSSPILDYFNKYLVSSVEVQDGTGGDPSQLYSYDYVGKPAWHYDDNQVVKAADRTWGQFRGFPQVDTLTGNPQNVTNGSDDVQTLTETRYFQGMNGDTTNGGGTTSGVTESDSNNVTYTDSDAITGQVLETQTFDGDSGSPVEVSATINTPSDVQQTASQARTGLPALTANIVRVTKSVSYTDLASGSPLTKTTVNTYDSDGRAVMVDTTGTAASGSAPIPETCTQTAYDSNTSTSVWITDKVREVIAATQTCPSSPSTALTATDIISDVRTYYDGNTSLTTPPTAGNPTMVTEATTNTGGSLNFVTKETLTYDSSGRVATSTDGDGNTTTNTYTPADGGPLTEIQVLNALKQQTTKTYDPGRGSLLSTVTPAGYETSATYDALGRLTAVWDPGRSESGGAAANITYAYLVSQTQPLTVTTNTLVDYGTGTNYLKSVAIYDSLGQLRQTQTAAEGGDSVVSDKFYDSHGWVWETNNKYVVSGPPSTSLVSVAEDSVNDRTIYGFDDAGRPVGQLDYNGATLTDSTQTVYGGDQVTSIDNDGSGDEIGTPSAQVVNVLGQQTEQIQYTSAPTVAGSVVSGGGAQVTSMTYNASGNQTGITDPDRHAWSYSYNLIGEKTGSTDPDTGTSTVSYDAAGNVSYTTDGSNISDNFKYDALNRKIAEYTGSTTPGQGTEIATWVYDTEKKGYLSYETSVTTGGTDETGSLGYNSYGTSTGSFVVVPSGQPLAGTYETTTTYSSTGLLLAAKPAGGGGLPNDSLTYTYDGYGNAQTEQGYDVYASGATWTAYNQIAQIDLGTGNSSAALTYTYSPQTDNITNINFSDQQPSPQVDDVAYTYNADQQITQVADTQGASGTAPVEDQCYTYDDLGRLNEAWTSSNACATNPQAVGSNATVSGPEPYWQAWTFDPIGDITSQTTYATAGQSTGNTTLTYQYGVSGHAHGVQQTASSNSVTGTGAATSYTYNGNGSTATIGSQSLTWDDNGNLTGYGPSSGATTKVAYSADGAELTEADTSGSVTTTTLFLPGEELVTNGTTTTGVRYYTFGSEVIGETTPSTLYWLDGNGQGTMTTAVQAFDESGTVIRRAATPYGTPIAGTGTWPDDRTFLNDPYDTATGLVTVGARQFDPTIGLFVSVDSGLDPANPQTMTGYTYAADDPINEEDPTGQRACMTNGDGGYYCYTPPDSTSPNPTTTPPTNPDVPSISDYVTTILTEGAVPVDSELVKEWEHTFEGPVGTVTLSLEAEMSVDSASALKVNFKNGLPDSLDVDIPHSNASISVPVQALKWANLSTLGTFCRGDDDSACSASVNQNATVAGQKFQVTYTMSITGSLSISVAWSHDIAPNVSASATLTAEFRPNPPGQKAPDGDPGQAAQEIGGAAAASAPEAYAAWNYYFGGAAIQEEGPSSGLVLIQGGLSDSSGLGGFFEDVGNGVNDCVEDGPCDLLAG